MATGVNLEQGAVRVSPSPHRLPSYAVLVKVPGAPRSLQGKHKGGCHLTLGVCEG